MRRNDPVGGSIDDIAYETARRILFGLPQVPPGPGPSLLDRSDAEESLDFIAYEVREAIEAEVARIVRGVGRGSLQNPGAGNPARHGAARLGAWSMRAPGYSPSCAECGSLDVPRRDYSQDDEPLCHACLRLESEERFEDVASASERQTAANPRRRCRNCGGATGGCGCGHPGCCLGCGCSECASAPARNYRRRRN